MPKNIRRSGSLGRRTLEKDIEVLRVASNTYGGAGQGTDHGTLTGRSDDDHTQYAHLSQAESVLGQWQFAPASAIPPFTLNSNAQGQLVTGLNADELDSLDSSNTPGETAKILKTATSGRVTVHQLNVTSIGSDLVPLTVDTYDLGSSAKLWRKGYLSELEALLFVENSIHVEGGWLIVGHDQGTLDEDVNDTQTTIDFGKAMTQDDFVLMRAFLQVEYFKVGTLVSGTNYNVARNEDGSGANTWPEGTVFLVLGNTGDGRIELVANQTDAPRISILEQGATYNAQTERVRIGNMRGAFGAGANDYYGFGVGDYSGGNYLKYNDTDGFIIEAGDGGIGLTEAGLEIINNSGSPVSTSSIRFNHLTNPSTWEGQIAATWQAADTELWLQVEHTSPHDATIRMYATTTSSFIMMDCEGPITLQSDVLIDSNVYGFGLGSVTITDGDLRVVEDIVAGSGFYAGATDGNPADGCFVGTGDLRIDGGIGAGTSGSTTDIPAGDVRLTGGLTVGTLGLNLAAGEGYFSNKIFCWETVNSKMTRGLTINAGTALDEQISLKGSDVDHGMSTSTEIDTAGYLKRVNANGGLTVAGWAETTIPLVLQGNYTTGDTTKSASGTGGVRIQARKKSGTTVGDPGTDENILIVRSNTTTRMILNAEGNLYLDGTSNPQNWDEYDDIKLLTAARLSSLPPGHDLRARFADWIEYARPILEATKVVIVNDGQYGNDDDGSVFMSVQGMFYLHNDAIRQLHKNFMEEIKFLKGKVLQLEARNESNN